MSSRPHIYTGEHLRAVAFPLGGIGTGTVSLGGRGQLQDWEVFNRPAKGCDLPYSFFAIWARRLGQPPVARIAERRLLPPFVDGRGLPPGRLCGLPRLAEARFTGEYPFAHLAFEDPDLPVELELSAWNPLIPMDADRSGIPGAVFDWTVRNPHDTLVDVSLAFSLLNAAGYDGRAELATRRHSLFGDNRNEWVVEEGVRGVRMTTGKYPEDHPHFGSLALLTAWPDTTHLVRWERSGWWDDLQGFWDDFSADGQLANTTDHDPSPDGQTDVASLALRVCLLPGQDAQLSFYLGWCFPNLVTYWNREPAARERNVGNHYARQFPDAWKAARYLHEHRGELLRKTEAYREALHDSTLPRPVLDAVSSQVSILRSTTCLRTGDGRFHAFEGCNDHGGCCPMNCTHVWNYEQALAFLFPELERSMRLTDFGVNTRDEGRMAFRTLLPLLPSLESPGVWDGPPAADGQMGCILKLYREWQLSGDTEWLRSLWADARRTLEFAWEKWDADRDGVMEGEQHNTYDIEFYGPNTMCGTLYLGALRAAFLMATHLEDLETAAVCRRLLVAGQAGYDALWNGEYFEQRVLAPTAPPEGLGEGTQSVQPTGEVRYQYGSGCLSDQLLGEWFAQVAGLGELLPQPHVRSALAAIFRHNFRPDLSAHASCQRTYALNDEGGLLLCTWPRGGRPAYPFPYADEVWTGIEYQVAAHLIFVGLVDEGLRIVETLRARHDGLRRNPWDEFECGHHYARALASWSLLLALSGFQYSAVDQRLSFRPRLEGDFRCFWAAGTAWGTYARIGGAHRLDVLHGRLVLREFDVAGEPIRVDFGCSAPLDRAPEDGPLTYSDDPVLTLEEGDWLAVETL